MTLLLLLLLLLLLPPPLPPAQLLLLRPTTDIISTCAPSGVGNVADAVFAGACYCLVMGESGEFSSCEHRIRMCRNTE
jgi:hypothetical protein